MKNKAVKRIFAFGLSLAMAGVMLTGCGKIKDEDVVVTVGDSEVTADIANFFARYQQAQYETYFSSSMGGGDKMWDQEVSDGKTYEDTIKESTMESLEQFYILKSHMKDFEVEITDDEKSKIQKAAKKFIADNGLAEKKAISASQKTAEEVLTLMTISKKMNEAMTKDVNTEVSDEEAAQKSMQYVNFKLTELDGDGNTKDMDDAGKEAQKKNAEEFAANVKSQSDFSAYAEKQGYEVQTATFDAESTAPTEEVVKAADALSEGQTTEVVETDSGYYVAKVTSLLERTATDEKKESIVQERKQEEFDKTYEKWKKDTKVTVNKKNWKKINFQSQGVTVKTEESEPYSE